jgi:SagB-type dehydrogenase family enzyme
MKEQEPVNPDSAVDVAFNVTFQPRPFSLREKGGPLSQRGGGGVSRGMPCAAIAGSGCIPIRGARRGVGVRGSAAYDLSVARQTTTTAGSGMKLPEWKIGLRQPVEEIIQKRRSVRDYAASPLELEEISRLLWAAQGLTDPEGFRAAPSAGALYPLELYLAVGLVHGLAAGVYRYRPSGHALDSVAIGDIREPLAKAALGQQCIRGAPAVIAVTGIIARTARKYGERAPRYVHMEAGHAAQNVYLEAACLGLGTVVVGAFHDETVQRLLGCEGQPLYLMPVGRPRD